MNIAIDESPLKKGNYLSHRVRGTGFYLTNLQKSLEQYYPENRYIYFTRGEKVSADVVHYPYFEPFFLTLPFSMPKKGIVTVHDMTPFVFPEHFPAGVKGRLKWQVQKLNLKKSAAIITDSEASKKDIANFAGISEEKIHVVYLAAGEHFKKKEKVKNKFNLPQKFALYVGDITWNKNLPNLIRAINETKVPLVIVGKTFLNENIDPGNPWNKGVVESQELASKNSRIIALGFIEDADLVDLYNLATIFVMPSFYEGFGLPLIEAMQSGCPIVTSNRGSIPEVVGDDAVFVEPEDVDSIKKGMEELFEDEALKEDLSRRGISRADKFSWRKTAEETMRVYKSVNG